jgi:hypothetical protein
VSWTLTDQLNRAWARFVLFSVLTKRSHSAACTLAERTAFLKSVVAIWPPEIKVMIRGILPPSLRNEPTTSVIWGEATYNYKPVVGWVITGTLQMYDQIFLRPRQSTSVTYSTTQACRALIVATRSST